jgi:MATE family multidrug resistance protein
MFITLAAVGLNWGLAEGLVHGRWGLPEMGLPGAGIATAVVNWFMLILLVVYIYRTEALRGYGLFKSRLNVDFTVVAEFFRLGVPIAGLVAVEAGLFMAVGLLSGVIGATTLAAHQVLMGWIGIPFVIALAMAEASMVCVAFQIGRGDPKGARLAGTVGIALGASVLTVLIAAPLLMAEQFTQLFISADDPGFTDVSAIVMQLMMIAAIFQVFDGIQVIAARSLRGVKDTLAPLWIGAFGYWVMGIGVGWVLAFPMGYDGAGLWTGLALGIVTSACLLTWRFRSITGRLVDRCNLG